MALIKIVSISLLLGFGSLAFAQGAGVSQKDDMRPTKPRVQPDEDPSDKKQADKEELAAARMLLSGYHSLPTQKELEAAFPNARELMMTIAVDAESFDLHRQRAVAALGYWPDAAVFSLYAKWLQASETSDGLRHQLIGHMVRVFGEAGLVEVASFLSHEDVQYRLTAVEVIGRVDSDAAQKLLAVAAEKEKNEVVLERIAKGRMQVR